MPSHLQGLNLIHPAPPEVDSQDLLHYPPDVAAQLALWTNLPFESEEGSILPLDDKFGKGSPTVDDEEDEKRAAHDSNVNLATGSEQSHSQQRPIQSHPQNGLDLNSLLNGYGLGGFPQSLQQHDLQAPSLSQILALHSLSQNGQMYQQQQMQQFPMIQPQQSQRNLPTPQAETRSPTSNGSSDIAPPPAKRARTRKASVSTTAESSIDSTESPPSAVTPAEDKRRRNTAASARFRLKKKEREFALETKAKELEIRVNELERECEGLRRENGWLKGLVVGVTGAAQNNAATQSPKLAGTRRSREDDSQ